MNLEPKKAVRPKRKLAGKKSLRVKPQIEAALLSADQLREKWSKNLFKALKKQ